MTSGHKCRATQFAEGRRGDRTEHDQGPRLGGSSPLLTDPSPSKLDCHSHVGLGVSLDRPPGLPGPPTTRSCSPGGAPCRQPVREEIQNSAQAGTVWSQERWV